MPDRRQHRGPHPQDHDLFNDSVEETLCEATSELSWLLSRGYAVPSSIKLVGDRHQLTTRQRLAVSRSACSDPSRARRRSTQVDINDLVNNELWVDGYNVLTSIEAALAGGVILKTRDGCFRDMASMHGSYRKVEETILAITLLGNQLAQYQLAAVRWLMDRPVSNSGRLKQLLEEQAERHGWQWHVELVPDPDPILSKSVQVVATADSGILNHAERWFNLAREVIERNVGSYWLVDLSERSPES